MQVGQSIALTYNNQQCSSGVNTLVKGVLGLSVRLMSFSLSTTKEIKLEDSLGNLHQPPGNQHSYNGYMVLTSGADLQLIANDNCSVNGYINYIQI